MTWADEHLRAFIDRVLRLKEEQDNLGKDIREVYAEAKANGFDKTVLGQVVAYLRKREKDPHKVEESEAIFDIYLHSYNRGTSLATHTRESDDGDRPAHDPTTGELIDDVPATGPATAPAPGAGGDTITAKGEDEGDHGLGRPLANGSSPNNSATVQGTASEEGAAIALNASSSQINPQSPSNRDVSTDSKAYSAAASQGQAAHAGTGSETLASCEGRSTGEGASVLSPINPEIASTSDATRSEQPSIPAHRFRDGGLSAVIGPSRDGRADEFGKEDENSSNLSQSVALALPVVTDAPVEPPTRDPAPGAPHSGEMPDLPAIFDRRSKAA